MNKKLSLLAATLLLAGAASAQTVSGTVLQMSGAGASGQTVYAMIDSTAGSYGWGSGVTDASGNYSFTLTGSMPPAGTTVPVQVYLYACGTSYNTTVSYNPGIMDADFTICNTTPPAMEAMLQGQVMLGTDSLAGATDAMVYVIDKHFDSTIMAYVLDLMDTISTGANGYYMRTYTSAAVLPAEGNLIMKAALKTTASNYADYLPSYHYSALNWSGANIVSSNYYYGSPVDIQLQEGVNPGGPGFISGSVLMGAGKTTQVGDPLGNRLVLLTTATGVPVAYRVTDASGDFSFDNLAYGTYKVFGDAWGKTNLPLTVTISGTTPSVTNIQFDENSTSFTGSFITTGVANTVNPQLAAIRVSPLPVRNELNINGLTSVDGAKTITLTSMSGQVIYKANLKAGADISIPANSLASGMYLLDIATTQGNLRMKVTK